MACAQRGSVAEVNSTRLLALNLRKLGGSELAFTPRSYVLVQEDYSEFDDFVNDFKVSQAFAVLKFVCSWTGSADTRQDHDGCQAPEASCILSEKPEGLLGRDAPEVVWLQGPDKTQAITNLTVHAAIAVTRRALDTLKRDGCLSLLEVDKAEWEVLSRFHPKAACHDSTLSEFAAEAEALLNEVPPQFQLSILQANSWLLKPSLNGGGNGRGILLMDRLPESAPHLLAWTAAVGRGGARGVQDALDGCVLQKLVEKPHLLDLRFLQEISLLGTNAFVDPQQLLLPCRWDDSQQPAEQEKAELKAPSNPTDAIISSAARNPATDFAHWYPAQLNMKPADLYKYNFRLWILASVADPPVVWLYKDSYVDLAAHPFTGTLEAGSQVTNLARGQRTGQRYWPLSVFSAYLRALHGARDVYSEHILPQARGIVCHVFQSLCAEPTSLPVKASGKLRRLGVDLLVDASHNLWLMEVNVLGNGGAHQYGLRAARGQESKEHLAERLVEEELKLKLALRGQGEIPATWENLSDRIVAAL